MSHPREILRRAEARRSHPAPPQPAPAPIQPQLIAPAPPVPRTHVQAERPSAAAQPPLSPAPSRVAVPRPIRQNSVYHQLMVRHDRMNPSHLKG